MNSYDTLIIGTGCAALKCADELCHMGRKSLAILTDDERAGTSRNAGSDKQTYYKLTLSGFDGDSVGEMARTRCARPRCPRRASCACASWAFRFPQTATANTSAIRPITIRAAARRPQVR